MSSTTRDIDQLSERKELPEGWRWVRLGDVCLPDRQIVEPNTSHAESLAYYSLEHIESETGRILKTPTEPLELEGKSMTFLFDQRHVLYGKLRPYLNKVALPFSSGRCTTEMVPLLPSDDMDRIFLAWLLRRQETVEFAMQGKTGSRMPRADMDSLLTLQIPFPPLPEQQRIAAILKEQMGAVEKARTAAQERLSAINALPAAFLRQIFPASGQPLPEGWRWAKLGEVCELNPRRPFIDRDDSDPTSFIPMESVDAVLGVVSSIRERQYGEVKKGYTFFAEADVLFSKITPCMQNGKHAIAEGLIDGIGFGTTEFHVIRPKEAIISEFIWFYVRQPKVLTNAIKHFTGAVGQQRVPDGYLAELEISLPPLCEQQRIAAIIKDQFAAVEQARTAAEAELKAINTLPAALLRRAFNGEL
jgi:type I restriction enzyme, S subunit